MLTGYKPVLRRLLTGCKPVLRIYHANDEPKRCESARLSGGRAPALGSVVCLRLPLHGRRCRSRVGEKLLRYAGLHLPSRRPTGAAFLLPKQESDVAIRVSCRKQWCGEMHVPREKSAPAANAHQRFAKPERATRGSAVERGDSAEHPAGRCLLCIRRQFSFPSALRFGTLRRSLPLSDLILFLPE
jgi:hypothetical protein